MLIAANMVLPPLFHFGFLFLYYWQKMLGGKGKESSLFSLVLSSWSTATLAISWRVWFQRAFLRVNGQKSPCPLVISLFVCLDCQMRGLSPEPHQLRGWGFTALSGAGGRPQGTGSKPTSSSEQHPAGSAAVWHFIVWHFCPFWQPC